MTYAMRRAALREMERLIEEDRRRPDCEAVAWGLAGQSAVLPFSPAVCFSRMEALGAAERRAVLDRLTDRDRRAVLHYLPPDERATFLHGRLSRTGRATFRRLVIEAARDFNYAMDARPLRQGKLRDLAEQIGRDLRHVAAMVEAFQDSVCEEMGWWDEAFRDRAVDEPDSTLSSVEPHRLRTWAEGATAAQQALKMGPEDKGSVALAVRRDGTVKRQTCKDLAAIWCAYQSEIVAARPGQRRTPGNAFFDFVAAFFRLATGGWDEPPGLDKDLRNVVPPVRRDLREEADLAEAHARHVIGHNMRRLGIDLDGPHCR